MKISQYYDREQIALGYIEKNRLVPLDFAGTMQEYILDPLPCTPAGHSVPVHEIRFASPVTGPSKIIAIGLNYLDHVRESKGEMPKVPIVFAKFTNTLIGHRAQITWNEEITQKVDFEAELAIIIGKTTYQCDESEAMANIFGYTCANDVSGRDIQFSDGQWVGGKSLDTFCPLGPWIVTSDDIPDPHDLEIKCWLNGTLMQDGHTSRMIFKIPYLVSFLSRCFTLLPGDVILTGTPHGVGAFRDPSIYLKDGDEIVVDIEGIGKLQNTCRITDRA